MWVGCFLSGVHMKQQKQRKMNYGSAFELILPKILEGKNYESRKAQYPKKNKIISGRQTLADSRSYRL